MVVKYCKSCDSEKPIDEFHFHPSGKYKRREVCKKCRNAAERTRKADPIKHEGALEVVRSWYQRKKNDPEFKRKQTQRMREYLLNPINRDKVNARRRRHRKKEEQLAKRRLTRKLDRKNYVSSCFGRAIYRTIGKNKKWRKWQAIVGYSSDELLKHLESRFKRGMSFDNYGEWHIDHIIPVAAFDFASELDPDFVKCWSLTNLQPLWAKENMSEQRFKILKCKCGARCWSADDSPCEGKMNVSEEYPMVYIHYCDKHGNPFDEEIKCNVSTATASGK